MARRYLLEVWQGERGLPQNTVTGVAQTPDGYLWVSTLDGLARFDGVSFKMFRAGDTPALGSGRIRFLWSDGQGKLWIATQEGGLIQLAEGRFSPLLLPPTNGVRSAVIQVAQDPGGALWLSTEDGKVGRLAEGRLSLVHPSWDPASNQPYQIRADAEGRLWAISDSGLYELAGEHPQPALEGKPGDFVVCCPSRRAGWWIRSGGQLRLWAKGQWLSSVPAPALGNVALTCSLEDHAGHVWLGTAGQGVYCCDSNGALLQLKKPDGLGSDFVRALFEDHEGNIWVGTEGGGLDRLHSPLFTVYGTTQGLSSERVTTVAAGGEGELWVGTDGYGLNRLVGDKASLADDGPEAASRRVSSVLSDSRGRLWIGLRYAGVLRDEDGHFRPFEAAATGQRTTRCLFEDSQGSVWIGQYNTTALLRVQGETLHPVPLPAALAPVDVRVMAEDGEGALWIGTDGSGLLRWKDGQFTRLTRESGLGSDFIWWLRPEPDGALWIGTYGGGLTRLKDGRCATCTTRQGLGDDVICCIADDGRGQFWFSSNQGVFRASKADLNAFADGRLDRVHCIAYGKSDGLPTLECEGGSQSAGCRSRDGRLWFPTIRGLVVINPAEVSTNASPAPVYIEELVVDGQSLGTNSLSPTHSRSPSSPFELPPGMKRIEFRYTALDFSAPEMLRFRHKLEGVDAEWVETGSQRQASYNQLTHGAYTFRVQACNREGVWSETGAALSFTVLPYYWQTGWFAGLCLVTFGGAVGSTVGYTLRRRHRRRLALLQRLHALERERTRIARDIHDDLGGSLTEIGYLGALAVRDSKSLDEVRAQLGHIMDRTRQMARRLDETVWAVNPKNDSSGHLAAYLSHYAREFLEPTGIRCRLDIAANLPEVTLSAEVRHGVFLVVKEALNNAAKHSRATELCLRLAASDGFMTIEVSDNGHGFAPDSLPEGGNGLRNMPARIAEMGGQFDLCSSPGQGTTVRLKLPLDSQPRPIRLDEAAGEGEG